MKAAAILALIALAGCSTYEERVANTCSRLGAPPGSSEYWPCVHHEMEIDQRDRAAGAGMMMTGAALLYRPPVQQATCTTFGNMTHCSGY